jgi:outer membrane immunogenic protein
MARPEKEVISMRRILLAGLALCAPIMPAMAADVAPLSKIPPPPVLSWTGFYIGANVGWAGSTDAVTNNGTDTGGGGLGTSLLNGGIPGAINLNQTGFIGGGQVGYNWQVWPNWVVGIEADFQGADAKGSNAFTFGGGGPPPPPITTVFSRELDWLGTLRGRFGYLWFPSLLFYGTGGLAYGENKIGSAAACPAFTPPCQTEGSTANQTSNTSAGWTLGAGAEWRFAPAWSLRAEYLYVDFGSHSNTISYTYAGNMSTLTSTVRERDNIVRFGVNYMFGY